jgi:PelA/Pel-15E family pectate lyase
MIICKTRNSAIALLATTIICAAAFGAEPIEGVLPYLSRDPAWFKSYEAKHIASNVLSWQSPLGGWPKNLDTTATTHPSGDNDLGPLQKNHPTFDNNATTGEMRYLAKMYNATGDPIYKDAFMKAFNYVLSSQYPSGGWPQFYPPDNQYHRYITFNDYAMTRLMWLLRDIYTTDDFPFVSTLDKERAHQSFDRGIDCILKCQIKLNGKLTAWCAQHDPVTYEPRIGRPYELPSISGGESSDVVRILMSVDHPRPQIVRAIVACVQWFDGAALHGIRMVNVPDPKGADGMNRVIVKDPTAPPIWARFYDLTTGLPIYASRDGVAKSDMADITAERRNGYLWLGYWPAKIVNREYPAWLEKMATEHIPTTTLATTTPTTAP